MARTESAIYWAERMEEIARRSPRKENRIIEEINSIYDRSARELEKLLNDFYQRYATESGLTLAQARRRIDRTGAQNLAQRIAKLAAVETITERQLEELAMLRAKFTTTRLQLLINEMDLILIEGYGNQQMNMDGYLKRTALDVERTLAGDIATFTRLATEEIEMIATIPWSGTEFSDRLWRNKAKLVYELQNIVTTGLIRGESTQSMARKLRKSVGRGKYESERLIRTETNYIQSEVAARFWEANGASKYEFNAKLDGRTSQQCRDRDGKIYDLKDRQVGTNYPPLHPFCRSFTIPVIEE